MKKTYLLPFAVLCFLHLAANIGYAQVRSSIGVGVGVNHPLQSGYRFGKDWGLQSNIRLNSKWVLASAIGAEAIKGNNKGTYNGYYFSESGRSVTLAFLRISGKYYFNRHVFATAGPTIYIGGEDAGSSGIGGTVSGGYDLPIDDYSSIEFSARTDVRPVYNKTVPVAGLGITYKFNFSPRY